MARRRIKPEELPAVIDKIIKDYEDDLQDGVNDVVAKVAKRGAEALRSSSAAVINSRYAQGWKVQIEKRRLGDIATIYHAVPGLPHLLEHGHAMPRGGRAPAKVHIAPVAETLETDFIKDMEAMIRDL